MNSWSWRHVVAVSSFEIDQLNVEDEGSIGRNNTTSALRTVPECRRDDESGFSTFLHCDNTLIPSLDELTNANCTT